MKDSVLEAVIKRFYETELKERDKHVDDEYSIAVKKAYKDTQRVLHGIGKCDIGKNKALDAIINKLRDYIENADMPDFEKEHNELCKLWANNLDLKEDHREYGKAQKIINMSFKYLYTMFYVENKGDKRLEKFDNCHFTLDSYTLRWLNGCKLDGKPKCLNSKTSWSTLDDTEYKNIQEFAKKCVGEFFPDEYNCLKAEFLIWECVKLYDVIGTWVYVEKMDKNNTLIENAKELFKENDNISLGEFMDRIKI